MEDASKVGDTHSSRRLPDLSTLDGAREHIANLEIAVNHRTIIGQAVGILMERFDVDADAAFRVLARLSQDQNRKVYDLAREIAERREGQRWPVGGLEKD